MATLPFTPAATRVHDAASHRITARTNFIPLIRDAAEAVSDGYTVQIEIDGDRKRITGRLRQVTADKLGGPERIFVDHDTRGTRATQSILMSSIIAVRVVGVIIDD